MSGPPGHFICIDFGGGTKSLEKRCFETKMMLVFKQNRFWYWTVGNCQEKSECFLSGWFVTILLDQKIIGHPWAFYKHRSRCWFFPWALKTLSISVVRCSVWCSSLRSQCTSNCKEENALKTAAERGTVSPSVKKYNRGTTWPKATDSRPWRVIHGDVP